MRRVKVNVGNKLVLSDGEAGKLLDTNSRDRGKVLELDCDPRTLNTEAFLACFQGMSWRDYTVPLGNFETAQVSAVTARVGSLAGAAAELCDKVINTTCSKSLIEGMKRANGVFSSSDQDPLEWYVTVKEMPPANAIAQELKGANYYLSYPSSKIRQKEEKDCASLRVCFFLERGCANECFGHYHEMGGEPNWFPISKSGAERSKLCVVPQSLVYASYICASTKPRSRLNERSENGRIYVVTLTLFSKASPPHDLITHLLGTPYSRAAPTLAFKDAGRKRFLGHEETVKAIKKVLRAEGVELQEKDPAKNEITEEEMRRLEEEMEKALQ